MSSNCGDIGSQSRMMSISMPSKTNLNLINGLIDRDFAIEIGQVKLDTFF